MRFPLTLWVVIMSYVFPIKMTLALTLVVLCTQSHARSMDFPSQYLLNVSDTEYKLALAQALSEICPSMLTVKQQTQFNVAYQNQIRLFMPNAKNPQEVMQSLASKQDYQIALKNMRNWTATFPPSENKALCQEFAQSSTFF